MLALELGEALEGEVIASQVARNARRGAVREVTQQINIKNYDNIADLFERKSDQIKKNANY